MYYFACLQLPELRPHCDDHIADWINRVAPNIGLSEPGSAEQKAFGYENKASAFMTYMLALVLRKNTLPSERIEKALINALISLTEKFKNENHVLPLQLKAMAGCLHSLNKNYPQPLHDRDTNRIINIDAFLS